MKALQCVGTFVVLSLASLTSLAADPSVRADKVEILPGGNARLSGNVVLSSSVPNPKVTSDRMTKTSDALLLEGNVRIEVGKMVFTTDRAAVVEVSANQFEAKMDMAVSSSP